MAFSYDGEGGFSSDENRPISKVADAVNSAVSP